jgi:hypothetical protein
MRFVSVRVRLGIIVISLIQRPRVSRNGNDAIISRIALLNAEKRPQAVPKKGILELRSDSITSNKVPNVWKCGENNKDPFESINTDLCVLLELFG